MIFLLSYIFDKLYHRANPCSSFRATVRFVCDRTTPPIIEKLRSKGVGRCYARVWRFRILLRVTRKSIKWTWAEPFEMNVKIEQELNFVVNNDRRLFLDAQEA